MKYFKCGKNVIIGLKELGFNQDHRMFFKYVVKLNGINIHSGSDLSSGSNMYNGLKDISDIGDCLLDFMINGDFLDKNIKQELENAVEYDWDKKDNYETHYLFEEIKEA